MPKKIKQHYNIKELKLAAQESRENYARVFIIGRDESSYKTYRDILIAQEEEYFFDLRKGVIIGGFCPCCDNVASFGMKDNESNVVMGWWRCLFEAEKTRQMLRDASRTNGDDVYEPFVLLEINEQKARTRAEEFGLTFKKMTIEEHTLH